MSKPQPQGRTAVLLLLAALPLIAGALYYRAAPAREERRLQTATYKDLVSTLKQDPANARALYYFGLRNRDLGRSGPALAALEQAQHLEPDDEQIVLARASIAGESGDDALCYHLLTDYLAHHSRSAGAHWALALFFAGHGDAAHATDEAETVTGLNPRDARAWRLLSTELLSSHSRASERAVETATTAVNLAPEDWHNQYALANALMYHRKYREAIPVYERASRMAPDQVGIVALLGEAQQKLASSPDELRTAVQTLKRAVATDPNIVTAQLSLGEALVTLHDLKGAQAALQHAAALDPWRRETHVALVKLYESMRSAPAAAREGRVLDQIQEFERRRDALALRSDQPGASPEVLLELGRLCARYGDAAGARQQFRRLLAMGDASYAAIATRALDQMRMADAQQAPRAASLAAVLPTGSAPGAVDTLIKDIDDLIQQHKPLQALDAARSVTARYPASAKAWQALGATCMATGHTPEGYRAMQQAVGIDASLPEAQFTLAQLYYSAGLTDEAIRRLKALTERFPGNAAYYNALADCLHTDNVQFPRAEDDYRRATMLDPGRPDYLVSLADMEVRNHKPADAERDYRRAVALAPGSPASQAALAHYLLSEQATPERQAEAERLLRSALKSDPHSRAASLYLGQLLLQRGDAAGAVPYLESAVNANPRETDAWYNLARAYAALHNQQRSQYCYSRFHAISGYGDMLSNAEDAAREHPANAAARLRLARLYVEGGYAAKAINQYQVYVSMAPNDAHAATEMQEYTNRLKAAGALPDMNYFNELIQGSVKLARR